MNDPNGPTSQRQLLTHTEAAAYLGMTPKRLTTLQGGIHHVSQIPTCRISTKLLYDIADLDTWIARHGRGSHYVRGPQLQEETSRPTEGTSSASTDGKSKRNLISDLIERLVRIETKVDRLSAQATDTPRASFIPPPSPTRKRYMNVREAADYLRVSRNTIYESDIPRVRLGRRILLDPTQLDLWLTGKKRLH